MIPAKTYRYQGEWLTVKQIAERSGLTLRAVYTRITEGRPLNAVYGSRSKRPKCLVFRGVTMTVKEIATHTGESLMTVYRNQDGVRFYEKDER